MAVLLCRCCGARLEIKQGASIVKCGCGVQQTVPILGFDEEALLWDRAEELRRSGEYDRAMSLYEQIAALCPDEPDVYWSKVLCRYGVEYVEEAESHRRIPTINRIQYTSVIDDEDYRKAVRLALNGDQRRIYILEAQSLDSLRGKILGRKRTHKSDHAKQYHDHALMPDTGARRIPRSPPAFTGRFAPRDGGCSFHALRLRTRRAQNLNRTYLQR